MDYVVKGGETGLSSVMKGTLDPAETLDPKVGIQVSSDFSPMGIYFGEELAQLKETEDGDKSFLVQNPLLAGRGPNPSQPFKAKTERFNPEETFPSCHWEVALNRLS